MRVHGRVNGQIKAKFVNLAKTAHVVGDILHENLSIQEGAFLEGHITHMSDADVKEMDKANGRTPEGKPGEDRVNLVVKAGTQSTVQSGTQDVKPGPSINAPKAVGSGS